MTIAKTAKNNLCDLIFCILPSDSMVPIIKKGKKQITLIMLNTSLYLFINNMLIGIITIDSKRITEFL